MNDRIKQVGEWALIGGVVSALALAGAFACAPEKVVGSPPPPPGVAPPPVPQSSASATQVVRPQQQANGFGGRVLREIVRAVVPGARGRAPQQVSFRAIEDGAFATRRFARAWVVVQGYGNQGASAQIRVTMTLLRSVQGATFVPVARTNRIVSNGFSGAPPTRVQVQALCRPLNKIVRFRGEWRIRYARLPPRTINQSPGGVAEATNTTLPVRCKN